MSVDNYIHTTMNFPQRIKYDFIPKNVVLDRKDTREMQRLAEKDKLSLSQLIRLAMKNYLRDNGKRT